MGRSFPLPLTPPPGEPPAADSRSEARSSSDKHSVWLRIARNTVETRLSAPDRVTLESLLRRRSASVGHLRRVRVILLSADGVSRQHISKLVGLSVTQVSRIRRRFDKEGMVGLEDQPRPGRRDHAVPHETIDRLLATALLPPPPGEKRWTTRLLGRQFNLTSATISKILRNNGLRPHATAR